MTPTSHAFWPLMRGDWTTAAHPLAPSRSSIWRRNLRASNERRPWQLDERRDHPYARGLQCQSGISCGRRQCRVAHLT